MKILIDRNIEINAITHKTGTAPQSINWGGSEQTMFVLQRIYCPPPASAKFRTEQLPYLGTVCSMAKAGRLEFYKAHELLMEKFRQRGRDEGYCGFNLLRDIPITWVKSPADRTIVVNSFGPSIGTTEEEQMDFFRSITNSRFLQIREVVGESHIDDAFHLWTAEEAGLDGFLTMDQKFWRTVNQKKHLIKSDALVLTPKELCELMNEAPSDIEKLAANCPPFS